MREAAVGRRLVKLVQGGGGWIFKVHGGIYQLPGVPDYVVVWNGATVWVETKAPGGRLSPIQRAVIRTMQAHGAEVLVGDDADALYAEIEKRARRAGCEIASGTGKG
ncbi:MAG TPA: VRR-NUC domain-containing protein [Thermoanaerobaculales bacterium]|nr:VRR-NUC domain-containing protein [Thermoanaerobaculales bacterium]